MTAIYFKEDKAKLGELIGKLEKKNLPVALYIFSWGKNEYKGEYSICEYPGRGYSRANHRGVQGTKSPIKLCLH